MNRPEEKALEITAQICISRASNSTISQTKEGGEYFAAFFEAIYNKVVEITKSIP